MSSALLIMLLCASTSSPPDALVVCPGEFRAALEPWVSYRQQQGHRLKVIDTDPSSEVLRGEIRRVAAEGTLRFLVLIGDVPPSMPVQSGTSPGVPTRLVAAKINVQYGSEKEIATDNWYADVDDDHVPDLAVGRLTADTPTELSAIVQKILAYEKNKDFGRWRRQVHFVAGLGGFGALADGVMEAAFKSLVTGGVPGAYSTTMTYGSWQSPYCPDPRIFGQVAQERLNEGSLFWVYIGHGQRQTLDFVRVPGGAFPILSSPDARKLAARHGSTIACLLACYSGAFDHSVDCLAEEMLRAPGGPVAILCSTRVSMPYGMAVLGSELLVQYFGQRRATLGEAVLAAKRASVTPNDRADRAALEALARAISPPGADLTAERAEHLDLFHILGDPLLRLPYAQEVQLEVTPSASAGNRLRVKGRSPVDGLASVELAVRRDRLTFRPAQRSQLDAATLRNCAATYARANDPRLSRVQVELKGGAFTSALEIPADARGACQVRVFVEGAEDCAAGSADVRIDAPAPGSAQPGDASIDAK